MPPLRKINASIEKTHFELQIPVPKVAMQPIHQDYKIGLQSENQHELEHDCETESMHQILLKK